MWADTVTLRVGDQLVGIRPDTDATASRIRQHFAAWVDHVASSPGEHGGAGDPVPWAFSLRLDAARAGRGPKAVPQLRIGSRLLARSRRADDMVMALDNVLGGVLARQDDTRRWLGLRTFVVGDRAVLVDATPPALTADPRLARAGVTELPTWSVAVDGNTLLVPPPLTAAVSNQASDGSAPAESRYTLAGLVAFDACGHDARAGARDGQIDAADAPAEDLLGDHLAEHHPTTPGALLARFAARHPSNEWFHTVEGLVADGRVYVSTDRAAAAEQVRRLLSAGDATG